MSARSRDLISATLITAGIPCAGEVYMAAGTTGAFESYWKDWFDNDRFFTGTSADATGCIQKTYDSMSSGRNDVMLVGPGTHHITTGLTWAKDQTHMVGAVARSKRPSPTIQPHGAVSPLITVTSTGTLFANVTLRNGQSTGSTACVQTLRLSSAGPAYNFTMRDSFIWGPEDDICNDSTGGWRLIDIGGDLNLFENCLVGYGWPVSGEPSAAANQPCLVFIRKSIFTHTEFRNCDFNHEFKSASHRFITVEYSPAACVFWTFRGCNFTNCGSTGLTVAIASEAGGLISAGQNILYFDANCAFHGVTDIAPANSEAFIKFSPAMAQSTDAANVQVGLAISYDHTS